MAIVIISLITGIRTAHAQSAIERLQPLVEISARRLAIAEQVALAKWDSNAAVEDKPREAEVIMSAVNDGESKGLDRTFVSNFFRDQIEANKVVQYSMLAAWHRAGRGQMRRRQRDRSEGHELCHRIPAPLASWSIPLVSFDRG